MSVEWVVHLVGDMLFFLTYNCLNVAIVPLKSLSTLLESLLMIIA